MAFSLDPLLQLVVRAALSLLFGWAAVHKLRDVAGFRMALENYDLMPPHWTVPGGAALIAGELGVAAGLWVPRVAPLAALAAAALLGLYAAAIAVNLLRGRRDIDCGCTAAARRQPIRGALVARNGVLAGAALLGALPGGARPLLWVDGITLAAGVAALACLYAAVEGALANARGDHAQGGAHG